MYKDDDEKSFAPLPPGRHGLSRKHVAASQHTRLLRAVCDAVGAKGYASTTIADIHSLADVSKKTFYVHFKDKDECFLTAYDTNVEFILEEMEAAYRAASGDWGKRYRASTEAFCTILSYRPLRTRALMLEVLAAGPKILARRRQVMRRLAAAQWMIARNSDSSSTFFGKLDSANVCGLGQSRGSGASFTAYELSPGLYNCIVGVSTPDITWWEGNPDFTQIVDPVFMVDGTSDFLTSESSQQWFYD